MTCWCVDQFVSLHDWAKLLEAVLENKGDLPACPCLTLTQLMQAMPVIQTPKLLHRKCTDVLGKSQLLDL